MKKIGKKLASILLAVALVVTFMPMLGTQTAYAYVQISFDLGSSVHGISWDESKSTYVTSGSYCWFVAEDLYKQHENMVEAFFDDSSPTVNVWPVDESFSEYNINDIQEDNGSYKWTMPEGAEGKAFRLVLIFNESVLFESTPFVVSESSKPVTSITISCVLPEVGETSAWQGSVVESTPEGAFLPSNRFDLTWREYDSSGNYIGDVTGVNGKKFKAGYSYELNWSNVAAQVCSGYLIGTGTMAYIYENEEIVPIHTFKLTFDLASSSVISGINTEYTYTGNAIKPAISIKHGSTALKSGTDYVVKYKDNTNVGTATVTITGIGNYSGTAKKTFTINKAANPLKIGSMTATIKYSKLKKKTQTLAITKVIKFTKKMNDKKTYTLVSAKKGSKSFKKYFKINKTTGNMTIKKNKKMKKGTYKVKVKIQALGNSNYKASAVKSITFKVKVK